jgi:hypothetical protein
VVAAVRVDPAVQVEHPFCAGSFEKVIDVLGDVYQAGSICHCLVGGVRSR